MTDNDLYQSVKSSEPKLGSTELQQTASNKEEQLDQKQLLENDQTARTSSDQEQLLGKDDDESVNISLNQTQLLRNDDLVPASLNQPGEVVEKDVEVSRDQKQLLEADSSTKMSQDHGHLVDRDNLTKKHSNLTMLDELAASCTQMTAELNDVISKVSKTMHGVSAITVANVQTCATGVSDLGGTVDSAVKSMYSMIACSEELDREVKHVHEIAEKVKRIQTVLTALEENIL